VEEPSNLSISHDDLVAEGLEAARHSLAVGRGLDQDPGAGPVPEHGGKPLILGADAPATLALDLDRPGIGIDHPDAVDDLP
jgi:hypothetical protein